MTLAGDDPITLVCDRCGEQIKTYCSLASNARIRAAERGWRCVDNEIDFCPSCTDREGKDHV